MLKTYSEEDKTQALAFLAATRNDFRKASKKTGIPENVIRKWAQGDPGPVAVLDRTELNRPLPPAELLDPLRYPEAFVPAPDLARWVGETFLAADGPLHNPDHAHLAGARIGFLWTNVPNTKQMRTVAGTAEIPNVQGGKWIRARMQYQLGQWFGDVPDFLITLDSVYSGLAPAPTFCALVEHEPYHCSQAVDQYGSPRFNRQGDPLFAIRAHDAEEFIGVVRRYGVGNAAGGVAELVKAALVTPEIGEASVSLACGTCLKALS